MAFARCVSVCLHDLLKSDGEESACNVVDLVQSLGQEDPLEKGMGTSSSIFAWRIPWTEEPSSLQYVGLQSVRQDWATNTFTFSLSHEHTGCWL